MTVIQKVLSFIVHSLEDTQYYVKKITKHGDTSRNCQQNDSFTHCESASEHVLRDVNSTHYMLGVDP